MAAANQEKLPDPLDLSHHLSRVTKNRKASNIKRFYKYFSIPGIAQLAGGLPNANYFPYDTLEAKTAYPERWTPTPNHPLDPPPALQNVSDKGKTISSGHVLVPKSSGTSDVMRKIDVTSALQYGTAQGYPPLYNFLRDFTRSHLHPHVPYAGGPEIVLTCGSTDGFSKSIQALNNEWSEGRDPIEEREGLLVEEYAYMNAIQTAKPRGMNIVSVKIDEGGMMAEGPGGLRDVLENWDFRRGQRPHLMYTVSIGQNPTGVTLSVERRAAIYALCHKFDIIIIEDDPYWYLQYPSATTASTSTAKTPSKSGFAFLDSLVPSYLSLDVDGRVVRLDTFSKTVAPGCRLGWVTAQPALVERILRIAETSTQQPSGFVQSLVAELLRGPATDKDPGRGGDCSGKGWEVAGFVRWLEGLRGEYERRMNATCDILEEGQWLCNVSDTVPSPVNVWIPESQSNSDWTLLQRFQAFSFLRPTGGMFVWLRFNFETHPLSHRISHSDLARALWLFWTSKPYRVLVAPGTMFAADDEIRERDGFRFVRICFAAIDSQDLAPVTQRFVDGVRDFWAITSLKRVKKILEDDENDNAMNDEANTSDEAEEAVLDLSGWC